MDQTPPTISSDETPSPRPAWVTPALLARTIEVWSEAYGRAITPSEALDILTNAARLGEVLLRIKGNAK